jgi:ferredoxin-type protein NapG
VGDQRYSRRDLLRGVGRRLGSLAPNPAPAAPRVPGRLRPPGWTGRHTEACADCTDCLEACPRDAIFKVASGDGQGTPAIDPLSAPCVLCLDLPCIPACPAEVLLPVTRTEVRMGTAEVIEARCRHHRGEACTTCHDACPLPGVAMILEATSPGASAPPRAAGRDAPEAGRRPVIVPEACTGCGTCLWACPERPRAIRIHPAPGG